MCFFEIRLALWAKTTLALTIAATLSFHVSAHAEIVAGIELNDLVKPSGELTKIMFLLEVEQKKLKENPQNPSAGSDWQTAFNKAVKEVEALVSKGDPNAAYILAHWGILTGTNVNINTIVDLYRKAGPDHPAAQIELAQILLQAFRQDADKTREAIGAIINAEKAGNALARRTKAQLHITGAAGDLIEQSFEKAMKLFEEGAKEGDGESTLALYQVYSSGLPGYPRDFGKALELLIFAAEKQNNATALGEYGARLLNGDQGDGKNSPKLVEKNVKKALAMFENSAKAGLPAAHHILGQIYESGVGENGADVPPDASKAFEHYTLAANAGNPGALLRLAQAVETGVLKTGAKPDDKGQFKPEDVLIQPNIKSALDLYRLAAQNNAAEAFFKLGVFYESGTLVDRDPAKAFALYTRAANAGVAPAMIQLAGLYANGNGATQDIVAAAAWLKRCADAPFNHPGAKISYGDFCTQGAGVDRNLVTAERYYNEAAQQGAVIALIRLSTLWLNGVGSGAEVPQPNYPLSWAYAQLANEATQGQSPEISQYVASLESAKKDNKAVFTEAVIKQGKTELQTLKKNFPVYLAAAARK